MIRRRIQYDYKVRLEWGKTERRSAGLRRWLVAATAPAVVALLAGMASHGTFRLPPWGALPPRPAPSAEKLLQIPVDPDSTVFAHRLVPSLESQPATSFGMGSLPNAVATAEPAATYFPGSFEYQARAEPPGADSAPADDLDWKIVTVRSGDSLARIFDRLGLSGADLDQILGLGGDTGGLKRLNPDQSIRFRIRDGALEEMVHQLDHARTLHVRNQDGAFTAETVVEPLQAKQVHVTGTIDSSLFEAGQSAGLSDALIMKLGDIFGYDIDFVLDLREGDRFTVVYEEIYKDGEKVKDGNILAAEFVNQANTYRAVRYESADGDADYYTPEGMSLRKAFRRTPVEFTRITSHFGLARRHPILNKIRAHKGVDYAAPTGTPVKATGDAKVAFAGWQGGYGKMVVLEHPGSYSTAYGHLSGFATGIKAGTQVKQGQTVGYVGQTGLATGPHLHYEFRVAGVHRDPLKVPLPKTLPVPAEHMADFKARTQTILAQLDEAVRTASGAGVAADVISDTTAPSSANDKVAAANQP